MAVNRGLGKRGINHSVIVSVGWSSEPSARSSGQWTLALENSPTRQYSIVYRVIGRNKELTNYTHKI